MSVRPLFDGTSCVKILCSLTASRDTTEIKGVDPPALVLVKCCSPIACTWFNSFRPLHRSLLFQSLLQRIVHQPCMVTDWHQCGAETTRRCSRWAKVQAEFAFSQCSSGAEHFASLPPPPGPCTLPSITLLESTLRLCLLSLFVCWRGNLRGRHVTLTHEVHKTA